MNISLNHQKSMEMNRANIIRFYKNGVVNEIISAIRQLKKENNQEVLYTQCGERILLDELESIDGIRFS